MLLLLSEFIGGGGDEIVPEHQVLGEWGTWGCTGEGFRWSERERDPVLLFPRGTGGECHYQFLGWSLGNRF